MNRERKLVTVRFVLDLTDNEYNTIMARDSQRRKADVPPLYELLESAHPVYDVLYYSNSIFYTVRPWNDTEEQHNLIANDIECYIELIENLLFGLDNGEDMG